MIILGFGFNLTSQFNLIFPFVHRFAENAFVEDEILLVGDGLCQDENLIMPPDVV